MRNSALYDFDILAYKRIAEARAGWGWGALGINNVFTTLKKTLNFIICNAAHVSFTLCVLLQPRWFRLQVSAAKRSSAKAGLRNRGANGAKSCSGKALGTSCHCTSGPCQPSRIHLALSSLRDGLYSPG